MCGLTKVIPTHRSTGTKTHLFMGDLETLCLSLDFNLAPLLCDYKQVT